MLAAMEWMHWQTLVPNWEYPHNEEKPKFAQLLIPTLDRCGCQWDRSQGTEPRLELAGPWLAVVHAALVQCPRLGLSLPLPTEGSWGELPALCTVREECSVT